MKKPNRPKKILPAEEFDRLHDSGADISEYVDWSKGTRPGREIQRINVDFPKWMIEEMDREAQRIGVPRQSIIKLWIAQRLGELEKKRIA
jgi:hypothetical protein